MKGLELTGRYAHEVAIPSIERELGRAALELMAVGSVGDGSDRFGFDDRVSRDHDWGVALCVWVPDDAPDLAHQVEDVLASAPSRFLDCPVLGIHQPCPEGRCGAMRVGGHYRRFTGLRAGPETEVEWDQIPEFALAAATNGEVFHDGSGVFSGIRTRLLEGYPRDILLKRLAERCLDFAQAGQSNLIRAVLRRDPVGTRIAYARCHEAACLIVHALSGRYCPYYKWAHASLRLCGALGASIAGALEQLVGVDGPMERFDAFGVQDLVERIAEEVLDAMRGLGLLEEVEGSFLLDYVEPLRARIAKQELLRTRSPRN